MSPRIKGAKKQFRTNVDSKTRANENERFSVDIKECKIIRVRENTLKALPGQNEEDLEHQNLYRISTDLPLKKLNAKHKKKQTNVLKQA